MKALPEWILQQLMKNFAGAVFDFISHPEDDVARLKVKDPKTGDGIDIEIKFTATKSEGYLAESDTSDEITKETNPHIGTTTKVL